VGVRGGRRAPDKTDIHNWVALSGIDPEAIALYNLLRMHVNRERGDDLVWTSQLSLAVMMGKPRADKISPLLKALEELGAIDIHKVGVPCHNEYTVHQLPPRGYTGPTTLKAWYALHRPLIDMKRDAEAQVRERRRARKKAEAEAAEAAAAEGEGAAPVTPESGQLDTPDSGQPAPPVSGQPDTPESGQPVAPATGREPPAFEPPELEPPPPTSNGHGPPPAPPAAAEDDWAALADELMGLGPPWAPPELRETLADPRIRERPFPLVRLAFVLAAQDGGRTWTPARLLTAGCPYWRKAHRQLNPPPADDPPAPPADDPPAPPAGHDRRHRGGRLNGATLARLRPWCGEIDCDPTTRQQVNEDGIPINVGVGEWLLCPRCGPDADPRDPTAGVP
jgi:hypothetical protein